MTQFTKEAFLKTADELVQIYASNSDIGARQLGNCALFFVFGDTFNQILPLNWIKHGIDDHNMTDQKCQSRQEFSHPSNHAIRGECDEIRLGHHEFERMWKQYLSACHEFKTIPSNLPMDKRVFLLLRQPDLRSISLAFEQFDATGKPDGFREAQKWFVSHPDTGLPYPTKIIWGIATSQIGRDFTAHQARDALRKYGLECAKLNPSDLPPEIPQAAPLLEGAERQTTRTLRERNPVARRLCIDHYRSQNDGKLACIVCKADFSEIYGELGEGFIHVHHLDPLAEANGARDVSPEYDLVPVCPNCHAMIHRNGATRSIVEIKRLMKRSKE